MTGAGVGPALSDGSPGVTVVTGMGSGTGRGGMTTGAETGGAARETGAGGAAGAAGVVRRFFSPPPPLPPPPLLEPDVLVGGGGAERSGRDNSVRGGGFAVGPPSAVRERAVEFAGSPNAREAVRLGREGEAVPLERDCWTGCIGSGGGGGGGGGGSGGVMAVRSIAVPKLGRTGNGENDTPPPPFAAVGVSGGGEKS